MRPGRQLDLVVSGNAHVSDSVLGKLERALEKQWGAPASPVRQRAAAAAQVHARPTIALFAMCVRVPRNGCRDGMLLFQGRLQNAELTVLSITFSCSSRRDREEEVAAQGTARGKMAGRKQK